MTDDMIASMMNDTVETSREWNYNLSEAPIDTRLELSAADIDEPNEDGSIETYLIFGRVENGDLLPEDEAYMMLTPYAWRIASDPAPMPEGD